MKIAIFHNYMDNIGGAEIVTLFLSRKLNADIYTTNIDEGRIKNVGFEDVIPRIKSIGQIPKNAPFKQQMALYKFKKLNLKNSYDFYIISGDWAMSAGVNHKPNLWYIHGPINELWEFKNYVREEMVPWWGKIPFDIWVSMNRFLTKKYSKHIDNWVCNSRNTKGRIKKYYKKEAQIIYPPVDTRRYESNQHNGYWLSVNRLINHKRIEMQLKAFAKMPDKKLVVVGSYEKGTRHFESYKKNIEKITPDNVEIIHWASNEKLKKLYSECIGFLTTSKNEDFGMTVIESMASGKPVIAPNDGGYKESVIDGETGILIDDIDEDKIVEGVSKIESNLKYYKDKCIKRSKSFDLDRFIDQIKEVISRTL